MTLIERSGKVVAEMARRPMRAFDARVIPFVAYGDPEVAWVGGTETEARAQWHPLQEGRLPLGAICLGREEGFTKLLFDLETYRILAAGIVGSNTCELIAEVALAIESGCDAADIGSRLAQCWSP